MQSDKRPVYQVTFSASLWGFFTISDTWYLWCSCILLRKKQRERYSGGQQFIRVCIKLLESIRYWSIEKFGRCTTERNGQTY